MATETMNRPFFGGGDAAPATVSACFEAQAARMPDSVAVVSGKEQVTYRELDERGNQLARYLQHAGVGPETLVGLAMDRTHEMLVAMMAILKAGGAYLPLDPAYPAARNAFVIQDSQTKLVVTTEKIRCSLPETSARIISLDGDALAIGKEGRGKVQSLATESNLAYVMYTSGSTGKPKGVMIENHNVINFFAGMDIALGSTPGVWLAVTSVCFDISVLELLWTLTRGFQVVVDRADGTELPGQIRKHRVTHFQSTPSLVRAMAQDPESLSALTSLKQLLIGGEAFPHSLLSLLRPSYVGEIHNMYGPTETTTWSTTCLVPESAVTISIGKPILNTQVYVLDSEMKPVPAGEDGELLIGGEGVARGYFNRPELTAERFVPNPFHPGGRLYRTGDMARFLEDGNLEYLGRTDSQVKIRGFRIELGEIEARLEQQHGIQQAVVTVHEDKRGDRLLVAYLIAKPGQTTTTEALRNGLEAELPPYMVPSQFRFLEAFPLTPNGKIDRKALPQDVAPGGNEQSQSNDPGDDPGGQIEQMLAAAWAEALGLSQVRRSDNFFDLGGHSLSALRVSSTIQRLFQLDFPLQTFIRIPVLSDQAKELEDRLMEAVDSESSARAFGQAS
jgi:amino acid adenylation domain-containing protein